MYYNFFVLHKLFKNKYLLSIFYHEHKTIFKQNINIRLHNYTKVISQKSVLYISL